MPKSHFPDDFESELEGSRFEVKDKGGVTLNITELRRLSDKLLDGHVIDRVERAVAGAAISHLLGSQTKPGETGLRVHDDHYYRLGQPLDDVVPGHIIAAAVPVSWCPVEQKWRD